MPDIQLLFRATPIRSWPYLPPFVDAFEDGFSCRAVLLRPQSRGSIQLRSADPLQPPVINQGFLQTSADRKTLRDGVRLIGEITAQKAVRPFVAARLDELPGHPADDDIDSHIRATAGTVRHPIGTCRMGRADDANSVVDAHLRVKNVEALRVVDASVMPDLTGGNINAVVIMIAEKAADLIKGSRL
jgi:choline dehydrogenase-like flavoprotein